MSDSESPRLPGPSRGFFRQTALQVKLVWRLMRDRRVSPLLKLLPVATVVYVFIPDILPGPIDDTAVVLGGLWLFIELCPSEVVAEHLRDLNAVVPGIWREVDIPKVEAAKPGEPPTASGGETH
jgi:uncharacterized membrane protein YkvA (DUF1232 family)